jgi:hypothetical protein
LIPENQVSLLAHSPTESSQGFASVPEHLVFLRPSEAASTRDPQSGRRFHSGCRRSSICFHFDARRVIEPGVTVISDYPELGLRSRHRVLDNNDLSSHTPPGSPRSLLRVSSDYPELRLGSRHRVLANDLSSHTPPGSPGSLIRVSSDYPELGLRSRHRILANDLSSHTPPGSPGSPIRVSSDYPELGLRSRHCVPEANDLSSHTPPGSPGSLIRVSSDYQTHDISSRIYPEALMAQPIDVSTILPNLAPPAPLLPSSHFAVSGSWSSSSVSVMGYRKAPFAAWDKDHPSNPAQPALTQPSNVPCSPLDHQGAVSLSAKGIAKSRPRPRTLLPRLLPGLLDPFSINSDEIAFGEDGSPCCSPKLLKGQRRPNNYRVHSRPREIPKLDYSLPDDFGKRASPWVVPAIY